MPGSMQNSHAQAFRLSDSRDFEHSDAAGNLMHA